MVSVPADPADRRGGAGTRVRISVGREPRCCERLSGAISKHMGLWPTTPIYLGLWATTPTPDGGIGEDEAFVTERPATKQVGYSEGATPLP